MTPHRLDRARHAAVRSHHDHRRVGCENLFLQQIRAQTVGQIHIKDGEVERHRGDQVSRAFQFVHGADLRAQSFQQCRFTLAQHRVVLYQQDVQT
jgi:hypothetical protein